MNENSVAWAACPQGKVDIESVRLRLARQYWALPVACQRASTTCTLLLSPGVSHSARVRCSFSVCAVVCLQVLGVFCKSCRWRHSLLSASYTVLLAQIARQSRGRKAGATSVLLPGAGYIGAFPRLSMLCQCNRHALADLWSRKHRLIPEQNKIRICHHVS
jgi:hypothetical protein